MTAVQALRLIGVQRIDGRKFLLESLCTNLTNPENSPKELIHLLAFGRNMANRLGQVRKCPPFFVFFSALWTEEVVSIHPININLFHIFMHTL